MKLFFLIFLFQILYKATLCKGLYGYKGSPVLFPENVSVSLNHVEELKEPDVKKKNSWLKAENSSEISSHLAQIQFLNQNNYDELITNDIDEILVPNFIQKEAPSCLKSSELQGLCEDDYEYDLDIKDRFDQALKNINFSKELYDNIFSKLMIDVPGSISSRVGNDIREDNVCPSTGRVIFPKRGKTESGDFAFLLNQDDVKQGIKIEECVNQTELGYNRANEDQTCSLTSDTGSESVCRQKYIIKKMLALDPTGKNIITESILIPSCCACVRKITANRVGGGGLYVFDKNGYVITEAPMKDQSEIGNKKDAKEKYTSYSPSKLKNSIDFSTL